MTRTKTGITIAAVLVAAAVLFGALCVQAGREGAPTEEHTFLRNRVASASWNVGASTIAAKQAASGAVRKFGAGLVEAYTALRKEAMGLASDAGLDVSREATTARDSTLGYLATLHSATLDREYMSIVMDSMRNDLRECKTQAARGTDQNVKAFASRFIPVLTEQLGLAEQVLEGLPKPVLK